MLLPLVGVAQSSLTHEQLEERYIKNSAWKYGMYSLEWQMSLDSALLIDSTFDYAGPGQLGFSQLGRLIRHEGSQKRFF
ncbi:MAG: hypothetical protein RIC35_03250 [Marinoscillum sp.]